MRAELIIVENDADHRVAMKIIDQLSSSSDCLDVQRLRAQSMLVADWEARAFPPMQSDPLETLQFWIEQSNLSSSDVAHIFGGRSHMSEVLAGKRGLSKNMFVRAHKELGVPLDALFALLEDQANEPKAIPAVPIEQSVTPDYIICLEDGAKLKMLKRHIASKYRMTPEDYKVKWHLPQDYPMVAPGYAKAKSNYAKRQLASGHVVTGDKPKRRQTPKTKVSV